MCKKESKRLYEKMKKIAATHACILLDQFLITHTECLQDNFAFSYKLNVHSETTSDLKPNLKG